MFEGYPLWIVICACCGIGFISLILACIISTTIDDVKDKIRIHKASIGYKKRMKIKPIAKCYCADCVWHCDKTSKCTHHRTVPQLHTGPTEFCSWGEKKEI